MILMDARVKLFRAGVVTTVTKHLPSTFEALGLILSTANKETEHKHNIAYIPTTLS